MKEKKHIDRLFQEKLKNFEATPKDTVWEKVNTSLHGKKKDKKPIPMFWKVAGIAAVLLLLITAGNFILNDNENLKNAPLVEETLDDSILEGENKDKGDNELTSTDDNSGNDINNNVDAKDPVNSNQDQNKEQTEVVSTSTEDVIKNRSKKDLDNPTDALTKSEEKISDTKVAGVDLDKNKESEDLTKVELTQQETEQKLSSIDKSDNKNAVANNKEANTFNKKETDKTVVSKDTETRRVENTDNKEDSERLTKLPTDVDGGIASENGDNPENESKVSIETEVASLDELSEKENEDVEKMNRWNISPNVAPVYFNTLGTGSSIDSQFNQNSKTGEINFSYGISGSYALSEKIKIRAGINKVDLGYKTNDVITYTNPDAIQNNSSRLRNIRYKETEQNTSFLSATSLSFAVIPEFIANNIKGSLDQEIGFIEVPLEMEYSLLKKKVGINVIGGFSAFFLNKNEVYTSLDGERRLIGEATNINNTSYSANLGLGFNFNFTKNIDINLEPTFKYQLNTFSDSSGDFQPYVIGIYSGLRFKF